MFAIFRDCVHTRKFDDDDDDDDENDTSLKKSIHLFRGRLFKSFPFAERHNWKGFYFCCDDVSGDAGIDWVAV